MAAYGAVVSLLQTLDTILHPGGPRISYSKTQLKSLHEKVSFSVDFLENLSCQKTSSKSAVESLERKIRDAAYNAEDLIETRMPNQLLEEPETNSFREPIRISKGFLTVQLVIFLLVRRLAHVGAQIVTSLMVQILMPVINVATVQSLIPVSLQNVIFGGFLILIPFMVQIFAPVLILSLISAKVSYLINEMILKGISFAARFRQYDSRTEDEEMRQVMDDFSSITREVIKINEVCGLGQDLRGEIVLSAAPSSRHDFNVIGKNVVVGFDSDLAEIKIQLTSDSPKIGIVSIVGMGGIGKTTLAREVYDDSDIIYHFDIRAWATISQEYSLRQVLLGLLGSARILTEKDMSEKTDELLAEHLYKSLKGRRYLVVMDDIWDTEIWDAVKRFFPEDNNGSRVLLTTRLSDVALYANSCSPLHRMRFLNQDESLNLLCNKVFGEKDCPDELEELAKEIARNCEGLPLAIAVIGGLLSKVSRTEECWRNVADNFSSVVTKDDEQFMDILSLSYNYLSHRLRACFLYMGMFPEDYEIPVPKLIRLWTAEGFLKPERSKSLEELAEECLKDLIERNLILACKRSSSGKIKTCIVHDVLRNLCIQNAWKENFFHVMKCYDDVLQEGNTPRRLSIHPDILSVQPEILHKNRIHYSHVHCLLCTGARPVHPSRVYLGYRLLRVLDLVIVRFFRLPAEIMKLVNLRYLAFTYNEALPSSISELRNLETLVHHIYGHCPFIPLEIWMMPKLRHLCVMPSFLNDPLDPLMLVDNFFHLEKLQTLSEVRNFRCVNNILKRIPNLRKLGISYDASPSEVWSSYHLEALVSLHQLKSLKLLVKNSNLTPEIINPPKLAFPQKLKKLTLSGCAIPWTSMTIIGSLPCLEILKLRRNACQGTDWEPVEEEFCHLKYLLLEDIDLVQWSADETHFLSLRRLIIRSCYKLKEIPSGIGEILTLELIELVDCHPSAVASAKQIEEDQESMGNMDLQVCVGSRKFYSRVLH